LPLTGSKSVEFCDAMLTESEISDDVLGFSDLQKLEHEPHDLFHEMPVWGSYKIHSVGRRVHWYPGPAGGPYVATRRRMYLQGRRPTQVYGKRSLRIDFIFFLLVIVRYSYLSF
jgi:hypothetical protein